MFKVNNKTDIPLALNVPGGLGGGGAVSPKYGLFEALNSA